MAILAADPQWRRFPFEMSLSLSPAPYHNLHPRIARTLPVGHGAPTRGVTS